MREIELKKEEEIKQRKEALKNRVRIEDTGGTIEEEQKN
jgi:hypothetical protein